MSFISDPADTYTSQPNINNLQKDKNTGQRSRLAWIGRTHTSHCTCCYTYFYPVF